MGGVLDRADIISLANSKSVGARLKITEKVCKDYLEKDYSKDELKLAEDIFRLLVRDSEVRVRATMSEALKLSRALPHDIAITLARDVETVAIPIIEFSSVLTEDDLHEIIEGSNFKKMMAIARREELPLSAKELLLSLGNEQITGALAVNDNFMDNEESFEAGLDAYCESPEALINIVERIDIAPQIIEKLMSEVAENVIREMQDKYDITPDVEKVAAHAIEISILINLNDKTSDTDIHGLIKHLYHFDKLTTSILLSALCMGKMRFFEAALAKKAEIPADNVKKLLMLGGHNGIMGLLRKSGMPSKLTSVIHLVLRLAVERNRKQAESDAEDFCTWLVNRLEYFSSSQNVDYLNYMLTIAKESRKMAPPDESGTKIIT